MSAEKIDYESWPRKAICEFFGAQSTPFYTVAFRQDVTGVYRYAKARGLSFYMALTWAVTAAMNRTEAFLYVIRADGVYRLSARIPSPTVPDGELFKIITPEWSGDIDAFCRRAKEKERAQTTFLDESKESDELVYISCLPWVDITCVTENRDLQAPDAKNESIPSIAWGKYTEKDGRIELGMSLDVNHRLIDGRHIGLFAEALTEISEELGRRTEENG